MLNKIHFPNCKKIKGLKALAVLIVGLVQGFIFWFFGVIVWSYIGTKILLFIYFPLNQEEIIKPLGKNYICPIQNREGRLGNHLFEYASIYGIAKLNNLTIVVTEKHDIVESFNLSTANIFKSYFYCLILTKVRDTGACFGIFDDKLMKLPADNSYVVGEYLQSWKYFRDFFPEIRREFVFREHIREPAEYIVGNLRSSYSGNVTMIGVHIRAGDVLTTDLLQQGYRPAPPSYVHNAIEYMSKRFKRIVLIVCSEDIVYARTVIGNTTIESYYFSISPAQDMAILAACDHVIMTVGTFGWWSGFLSNGTVIYYKYPYTKYTSLWGCFDKEDFYPPNWIGLE